MSNGFTGTRRPGAPVNEMGFTGSRRPGAPVQTQSTAPTMSAADIDAEIAQLEQELTGLPQVTQGPAFEAPQAPGLPGAEMLQNPLLRAIQDDVTRRVFANQRASRRGGAGETAVALQNALAPTALNLGLTLQGRQQTQQQQNIDNLMRLFGMGANVAAGQGSQGLAGASALGSALQAGGAAQAGGALGQGQAIAGGLGDVAGFVGQQTALNRLDNIFNGGGVFSNQQAQWMQSPAGQLSARQRAQDFFNSGRNPSSIGGGLYGTPFQPTTQTYA